MGWLAGHRAMRRAALVALLVLGSCANTWRTELQARLTPLVGVGEDDLVRRMGVPNRTFETGDRRFLAYVERWPDVVVTPFVGFGGYYGAPGFGYGWGYAPWPQPVERQCEITFELAERQVLGFTLRGSACGWGSWPIIAPA